MGIILLSIFTGCQNEELNSTEPELTTVSDGEIVTITWLGTKINVVKKGDLYMLDDMIIDVNSETESPLRSTGNSGRLWPNNTVYYKISNDISYKASVIIPK